MNDVVEVTQLILRERQARDRGWWDVMRSCFAADSTARLSWFQGSGPDFVTQSARMAGRGDTATHRLSPPVVRVEGDRAFVELPAVIELRTELDGVEVDLSSAARLLYRAERRSGRWWIISLDPVYERDQLHPALPGTSVRIAPGDLAAFRPSYRLLSYALSKRGYQIADDLYGDDRPDETAELYRTLQAWLTDTAS